MVISFRLNKFKTMYVVRIRWTNKAGPTYFLLPVINLEFSTSITWCMRMSNFSPPYVKLYVH